MRAPIKTMAVGALLALLGCSDPPQVLQGKVVSYDTSSKLIVLQDEAPPHLERSVDLASAEIGSAPAPGNVVRVTYRDRGGKLVAGRVMNVTPQKK
jgi:hypothetical protein